jgi:uncharacterized protein YdiU (UPF0061 family)
MRAKLGLTEDRGRDDDMLIAGLLTLMTKARADYTLTFRGLSDPGAAWTLLFGAIETEAAEWLDRYRSRMADEGDRRAAMDSVNPHYVLRNWVAETAIRAVEDQDDAGPLDRILRLVQHPFDTHPGDTVFAQPPSLELSGLCVSCSS